MSPTRRDLFKRVAVAAVAGVSGLAGTQSRGLASVIDVTGPGLDLAAVKVALWEHWYEWPAETRARFLAVIDREFPVLSAEAVALIEARNNRLAAEDTA